MGFSLHNKVFTSLQNSESGEVDGNTVFHYYQQDEMIWAEYAGGEIKKGFLIGSFSAPNQIRFSYQHLNQRLENRLGQCESLIERLPDGRLRLTENWQWLDGEKQRGQSVIEEIR